MDVKCDKCNKPIKQLGIDGYRYPDKIGIHHNMCKECFEKEARKNG